MLNATMGQLMAAVESTDDGQGNMMLGLLIGAFAVVAAVWWLAHRYRVARRPAASRAEHEMLREVHRQRPEQKAVQDQIDVKYLRRGGF